MRRRRTRDRTRRLFSNSSKGGAVEITASYPAGVTGDTASNLREAAAGENEEWSVLYPEFARIAREEGFDDIGRKFDQVAKGRKGTRKSVSCPVEERRRGEGV